MMEEEVDGIEILGVAVDPSATSVTGLVILPASVVRKKIVVTSAMVLVTLPEIVVRTKIPATTATRLGTLLKIVLMLALKHATSVVE